MVKNSGNRTHKKKFGFSKNKEDDHTKDRKEEIKADPDNEMKLHENKEIPSPILEVELEATAESVEKTALPDKEVKKKKEKRAKKAEKSNPL